MAKMEIEVTYDDGEDPVVVAVKPKAIVQFEASGNRMSADAADGMSWIYKLAWFALGRPKGTFEDWLDTVDDCTTVGQNEESEEGDDDAAPFTAG